ncbi:MAG: hypothetical protein ACSHYF_04055 [Verrucomicrobiaceae bacterium]
MRFAVLSLLMGVSLYGQEVLSQKAVHAEGCGPCALVNQLRMGGAAERAGYEKLPGKTAEAKARGIIGKYGNRVSPTYRDGRAVFRKSGVTWQDMQRLANWVRSDVGLPELEEAYLDRKKDEGLDPHLKRIHGLLKGSLDEGVMPIISFRSFGASYTEEGGGWLWKPLYGHFVLMTEIQEELAEGEKGFRFRFADSATGQVETGYAHLSEARNFTAVKGSQKDWVWAPNRPFLVVTAPTLRLKVQDHEWYARTFITLNHAVYAETERED